MPRKKSINLKTVKSGTIIEKVLMSKINLASKLEKINIYLTTIFLLLWIFIGIFGSLVVIQSVKQGFLKGVFSSSVQTPASASQAPAQTEADLPGVGRVNIACVQQALSSDAIQKVLTAGNTDGLTDTEKTKLAPCIVAPINATPSATPAAR
jgi:hypothetical protein